VKLNKYAEDEASFVALTCDTSCCVCMTALLCG